MARVFVSSTFVDLQDYREEVRLAIRRAGHEDIAMEYYVAEDKRPVDRCLEDVRSCDLYIGLFAWCYGWIPKTNNPKRISITEMEYREAVGNETQCLIFLLDPDVEWKPARIDQDRRRITRLRELLRERHGAKLFRSRDELGQLVAHAIHQWASRVSSDVHATNPVQAHVQSSFLDSACPGATPDALTVESFRTLLKFECRHEFPVGLSAHDFLAQNGLMAGGFLTRTAILMFRSRPDTEVPSALVRFSEFGQGQTLRPHTAFDVRGPLSSQITDCLTFVRQYTKTRMETFRRRSRAHGPLRRVSDGEREGDARQRRLPQGL